jgi:hypothetical protein
MDPADEMAAKIEPTERQSADGVAGSDDTRRLRATLNRLQRISLQSKPIEDLHGSGDKLNEQLEDLLHPQRKPVEDLQSLVSGIDRHLDYETSERKTIYDRLRAIDGQMKRLESQTKRRASGAFGRYLVAICIGVVVTLAWQPYGEATKQIMATRAPELGWSPETKQMIASWIQQLGWTKLPVAESTAAPVAQTAPEIVASKAPAAPSLDPEQVHQIALDVETLRQTVEQLTASQDQMAREIEKLSITDMEILAKLPAPPPPRPIAAPARKPTPTTPPSSRTPIPPRLPPHP